MMDLTLVGLGVVCSSIGMALKAVAPDIRVTGHDRDAELARRAKALKAVDKTHWNLISACEGADLIVLDLPLPELETTLQALVGEIGEETVLLDTLEVKRAVLRMARRILPDSTRFIGGHIVSPRFRGQQRPDADLVRDAAFYVVASPEADQQALDMVTNLAIAIGAHPKYIDAAEHDGIMAAVAQLPFLSALATVGALRSEAGSRDRAHAAGAEFAAQAALLSSANGAAAALVANADYVAHWTCLQIQELTRLNALVQAQDVDGLRLAVGDVVAASEAWLSGSAEQSGSATTTSSGWRQMLLGRLGRAGGAT